MNVYVHLFEVSLFLFYEPHVISRFLLSGIDIANTARHLTDCQMGDKKAGTVCIVNGMGYYIANNEDQ